MPISQTRIEYLLQQYAANNCTKKELLELLEWVNGQNDDADLRNAMQVIWQNIADTDMVPAIDKERMFSRILSQVAPVKKNANWWLQWGRLAAASVLFAAIASTVYFLTSTKNEQTVTAGAPYKGDVAPGHNGAVLTLSNGQKIVLDSAGNGVLVKDGEVDVLKNGNEITYRGKTNEIVYNNIATSKGQQWQLRLPDGTKVWLNAASSINYPLNFTGSERNVEITGEAYFEVAHNPNNPFKVTVKNSSGNGGTIEDIGTAFNVNAYDDEPVAKTTLVEGIIKLSVDGKKGGFVKAGQQAMVSDKGANTKILDDVDTEDAIAWKDGLFKFNDSDIKTIMRQIGRWYNVSVVYEGAIPEKQIYGTASRNTNLSSILKVLSLSGVHVELSENKIIIKP
ncbi:MAG: FecR domain-containing protein [Ferruginibacter sp.]